MTLKQKITNAITLPFSYDKKIQESLIIAGDFAIGFAEWKDKNCYLVMGSEVLFYIRDNEIHDDAYTNKELLEIYKKEKGL